jgi:hypothetical protein
MGKGGTKSLELGPEFGASRKEALGRLLESVEREIWGMVVKDGKRADKEGSRGKEGGKDKERERR